MDTPTTPEEPEGETLETPEGEIPETPEGETQPEGIFGITGAVIGALGTGGSIALIILAIGGVGTGSYFYFRKRKQ